MENLKNEFENFMGEMIENNLNTLKRQNAEYSSCKDDEKNIVKTMNKLIDKLSDKDKELLNKHEMQFLIHLYYWRLYKVFFRIPHSSGGNTVLLL